MSNMEEPTAAQKRPNSTDSTQASKQPRMDPNSVPVTSSSSVSQPVTSQAIPSTHMEQHQQTILDMQRQAQLHAQMAQAQAQAQAQAHAQAHAQAQHASTQQLLQHQQQLQQLRVMPTSAGGSYMLHTDLSALTQITQTIQLSTTEKFTDADISNALRIQILAPPNKFISKITSLSKSSLSFSFADGIMTMSEVSKQSLVFKIEFQPMENHLLYLMSQNRKAPPRIICPKCNAKLLNAWVKCQICDETLEKLGQKVPVFQMNERPEILRVDETRVWQVEKKDHEFANIYVHESQPSILRKVLPALTTLHARSHKSQRDAMKCRKQKKDLPAALQAADNPATYQGKGDCLILIRLTADLRSGALVMGNHTLLDRSFNRATVRESLAGMMSEFPAWDNLTKVTPMPPSTEAPPMPVFMGYQVVEDHAILPILVPHALRRQRPDLTNKTDAEVMAILNQQTDLFCSLEESAQAYRGMISKLKTDREKFQAEALLQLRALKLQVVFVTIVFGVPQVIDPVSNASLKGLHDEALAHRAKLFQQPTDNPCVYFGVAAHTPKDYYALVKSPTASASS
eukprot:m.139971 g.139971  ORF g.139971 m.139971 type:complete len:570 (+) comp24091_c0_seq2:56-1765(+)